MVDLGAPLNERQREALRWIADGCPAEGDVMGRKRSARALADRRMAVVSRRGGAWTATLTDAGRFYLEHGHHQVSTPVAGKPAHRALEEARAVEPTPSRKRGRLRAHAPSAGRGAVVKPDRTGKPMRYRIVVSRVQVAERYVRAPNEEQATKKVQEELSRQYGFMGQWRTVDTDIDVAATDPALDHAPGPLNGNGAALLSIKDAAAHLGIPEATVRQLVAAGEIPNVPIGSRRYISREDLIDFIHAHTHLGDSPR